MPAIKFCHQFLAFGLLILSSSGCTPPEVASTTTAMPLPVAASRATSSLPAPTATTAPTATPTPRVPHFAHILMIVLENKEFGTVVGSPRMPYFNQLADSYTLLTEDYAVAHPSLPNYLAMIGGDTFGITFDCTSCPVNAPSLPDLIEASGRTWKTYQEDMPSACFAGAGYDNYALKHNPFMYFMPIRLAPARCTNDIVPFSQLAIDLAAGALPNFVFITPNLCNDAHDCSTFTADTWLQNLMPQILPVLDASGQPYLIIITWDEGQGNHSCCGLPAQAGGRVATILISPQAKNGFQDDTPYTHYSLLKTISEAWQLAYLGHAGDAQTALIVAPWK